MRSQNAQKNYVVNYFVKALVGGEKFIQALLADVKDDESLEGVNEVSPLEDGRGPRESCSLLLGTCGKELKLELKNF